MNMVQVSTADLTKLGRMVAHVADTQSDLQRKQDLMQSSIGVVADAQDRTQQDLLELKRDFHEYLRRDELRHNLQVAHTEILQVRQELETKYGHFGEVRRLATGTLQALDVGIVSHGTMRSLTEELMLVTPRYWLAPALVAVAAWIRDDPELARKALAEATRRDSDKASLFFALILRRHQRNAATARWLRQYTARQDPEKLSREFTVILDAVSQGAFGHESRPLVMGQMSIWYDRLSGESETVDKQIARWAELIDTYRRPVDGRYQVLSEISPTWPQLKELYEGATVHGEAEQRFRAMFTGPVPQSEDLRERVDDILDGLVTGYDVEESPLRRKEHELQEIVKAEGDKDIATKAVQAARPLHETTVDFLTLISNAAVGTRDSDASLGTRRFAVALAKDWIVQGAGRLEAANVSAQPAAVEFQIEGWTERIDTTTREDDLVAGLADHIDAETEAAVSRVRFVGPPLNSAIAAGICLIFTLWAALAHNPGLAVFLLIGAGAAGAWSGFQARGLPAKRAELRKQGEQRKAVAVAQLRGGIAELVDLRAEWERELASATSLRDFLNRLNEVAFAGPAPDQRRGA
ncbi:hypothetical protein GCM10027598_60930 [Amycolatopsis oliviviridis]|uniref:Uncharacterized protein n=1 Tax=Amycolatopsis oliviviridis TaxID=1471590 RepID=A0ABQ3M2Z2_9PSEU|nr:hypothetical protein [Amycolatopsis oliviviridis]GHH32310.1 hypothetical protein GCM10017790_69230 [Amycolatopsis oliviviridis]